jgi:hypothetical protein
VPAPHEEDICGVIAARPFHCFSDCDKPRLTPGPAPPRQKSTPPSVPPVGIGEIVAVSVTVCPVNAVRGEAVSVVVVGVSGCTPVPVTTISCVPAAAGPRLLSVKATASSKPPAVGGSNTIPKMQSMPRFRCDEVEQDVFGPLKLNPVGGVIVAKISGWFPMLVTVTSCGVLSVLTFCEPKSFPWVPRAQST